MDLDAEIMPIVQQVRCMHINDPRISQCWDQLEAILLRDQAQSIAYLQRLENPDVLQLVPAVFPEVAWAFQSQAFIDCIEGLQQRFPDTYLQGMVNAAKGAMENS